MSPLYSETIRDLWKKFRTDKKRNHKELKPAGLISDSQDKTVLFNVAGMQQLVPYLSGKEHPLGKRLYNIQGCIRTNDIEEVGDERHLTFFEMMGNRSLGDYFKKEAIERSWEFLTDQNYLGLDMKKFAVTIFEGNTDATKDEDSWNIRKKTGISEDKISSLSKKDNWRGPAGNTGPCGPDTEIFWYKPAGIPSTESNVKSDEDSRLEIRNNVFMEFYKDDKAKYTKLANQNVDTGMGLERICMILQNKETVFETDLFNGIIKQIEEITGQDYPAFTKKNSEINDLEKKVLISFRIIADHIRSSVFLIAEGLTPSNEGRGYVLRRLIRRMYYHIRKISAEKSESLEWKKFEKHINTLIEIMFQKYGKEFPHLAQKEMIVKVLITEMQHFRTTLEKNKKVLEEMKEKALKSAEKKLTGKEIFFLYDTLGIPLELIKESMHHQGLAIDENGFQNELEAAKQKSRSGSKAMFKKDTDWSIHLQGLPLTQFIGYDQLETATSRLLKTFELHGQHIYVFDKTPFYAEGGGQTADKGTFILDDGKEIHITDVQNIGGVYVHFGAESDK